MDRAISSLYISLWLTKSWHIYIKMFQTEHNFRLRFLSEKMDHVPLISIGHDTWVLLNMTLPVFNIPDTLSVVNSDLLFFCIFFFSPQHKEFSFLLKERVCPLVIKLFSPSIKHRQGMSAPAPPVSPERPSFPINMRLLRVVSVLINKYYTLLVSCLLKSHFILDKFYGQSC